MSNFPSSPCTECLWLIGSTMLFSELLNLIRVVWDCRSCNYICLTVMLIYQQSTCQFLWMRFIMLITVTLIDKLYFDNVYNWRNILSWRFLTWNHHRKGYWWKATYSQLTTSEQLVSQSMMISSMVVISECNWPNLQCGPSISHSRWIIIDGLFSQIYWA